MSRASPRQLFAEEAFEVRLLAGPLQIGGNLLAQFLAPGDLLHPIDQANSGGVGAFELATAVHLHNAAQNGGDVVGDLGHVGDQFFGGEFQIFLDNHRAMIIDVGFFPDDVPRERLVELDNIDLDLAHGWISPFASTLLEAWLCRNESHLRPVNVR